MALRITSHPAAVPQALDPTAIAAGLGATGEEAAVGKLIERMTDQFERLAGLKLWYRGYREVIEGGDDDRLYLSARPVVAVSSVAQGTDDPLDEGSEDDEYEIWDSYLYRADCWPSGRPPWTVNYTAGWWLPSMGETPAAGTTALAVAQPEVELAIQRMVELQWQIQAGDQRVRRAKLEGMALEIDTGVWIPKTAERVAAGLKRPVV